MIRADALTVLQNYYLYEWETQGFGMLRTYLDGENEPRLQVWDQRLLQWGAANIHDHPWDFTSTIVAGNLFNQRFRRFNWDDCGAWFGNVQITEYNEVLITPGPVQGGDTTDVGKCYLAAMPIELYGAGEHYSQKWDELHCTHYMQGTVTIINRERTRPDGDLASSIWKGDGPWVSARPRTATEREVRVVIENALKTWF